MSTTQTPNTQLDPMSFLGSATLNRAQGTLD